MMITVHQLLVSTEIGGAAGIALSLADATRASGRATLVWAPGIGMASRRATNMAIRCGVFDAAAATSRTPIRAAWANMKLCKALRQSGPGLVHVHSPGFYGALRWGLRFSGLRRVAHVHIESDQSFFQWAFRQPPELIITCARFLERSVSAALPQASAKD